MFHMNLSLLKRKKMNMLEKEKFQNSAHNLVIRDRTHWRFMLKILAFLHLLPYSKQFPRPLCSMSLASMSSNNSFILKYNHKNCIYHLNTIAVEWN